MKRFFLFCVGSTFTLSYAIVVKQNNVYNELCESQIRTAKIFLNAFEVNTQKAKIMLGTLKLFFEHFKNNSDFELITKPTEKMFERRESQVINSENDVQTCTRRLHVKIAKASNVIFDKIARNYVACCNASDYTKYENNSNVGIVNINNKDNEKYDELFNRLNRQVKANEIFINFLRMV
jgi:hypothetical protein